MARTIRLIALVAAVIAAQQAAPAVLAQLPTSVVYRVTEGCQWEPRAWAALLGADASPPVSARASDEVYRCQLRRGLKSRTPHVKTLLQQWPSTADLAAWEGTEDANGGALH